MKSEMSNLERIEECSLTDEYIIDMITDMERIPDNDGQVYTLHIENTTQDISTFGPMIHISGSLSPVEFSSGSSSHCWYPDPSSTSKSSRYAPLSLTSCSLETLKQNEILSKEEKKLSGKKRGCKPKAEKALHQLQFQKETPKKIRAYEKQPLENKLLERKRLNAVNAKKCRDRQKATIQNMINEFEEVSTERDALQEKILTLEARVAEYSNQLKVYMNYINNQQLSAFTLLESASTF